MGKPKRWDTDTFHGLLKLLVELRGEHGGISEVEVHEALEGYVDVRIRVFTQQRLAPPRTPR